MARLIAGALTAIAIGSVAPACSPNSDYTYVADARSVVISADFEVSMIPALEGETCRFPSVPVLKVWGDGLAFVRAPDRLGFPSDERYRGVLTPQQLDDLLAYLGEAGFFGEWTPGTLSPAGDNLDAGVNLAASSTELTFGVPAPRLYLELLKRLMPALARFTPDDVVDPRISALNATGECSTPTPDP
jgi:hypothetical protein